MILLGHKEAVRDWIYARVRDLRDPPKDLYEAIGVAKVTKDEQGNVIHVQIIGGVLYSHYHELAPGQHDCMLTAAGEPGWLTRGNVRILLRYPFVDLRCIRLTSIIAKSNKASRTLNERLGFRLEGCIKHGRGIGKDALLYGLIRADAEKWIR